MLAWNYTDEEMLGRRVYRNGVLSKCVVVDQWLGSKQKRLKRHGWNQ